MSNSQPTLENSSFSLTEQSDTPQENWLSEHPVLSGEINPSDIPRENKVVVVRLWWKKLVYGASREGRSDTGSGSELDLTSTSKSESASDYMPAADLQSE